MGVHEFKAVLVDLSLSPALARKVLADDLQNAAIRRRNEREIEVRGKTGVVELEVFPSHGSIEFALCSPNEVYQIIQSVLTSLRRYSEFAIRPLVEYPVASYHSVDAFVRDLPLLTHVPRRWWAIETGCYARRVLRSSEAMEVYEKNARSPGEIASKETALELVMLQVIDMACRDPCTEELCKRLTLLPEARSAVSADMTSISHLAPLHSETVGDARIERVPPALLAFLSLLKKELRAVLEYARAEHGEMDVTRALSLIAKLPDAFTSAEDGARAVEQVLEELSTQFERFRGGLDLWRAALAKDARTAREQ